MRCVECAAENGHADGCVWARDLAARYFELLHMLDVWRANGGAHRLREASDKLSELTAWAAGYEYERQEHERERSDRLGEPSAD